MAPGALAAVVAFGCIVGVAGAAAVAATPASVAPLADAAEALDLEAVDRILGASSAAGAPVEGINAAQVDGTTALHWAVHHDRSDLVHRLLDAGADVAAVNRYGVMPLALACVNGTPEVVAALLSAGADPNARLPGGETVFMTAARTGRIEVVEALHQAGADVRFRDPRRGQTALMWAAAEGNLEVVELLLEVGADPNTTLDSGFTPLLFAVREGRVEVVEALLRVGVDVNAATAGEAVKRDRPLPGGRSLRPGSTPLLVAVTNGHFELAAWLLDAGADPNADQPGYTPLHMLARVRKPGAGDNNPRPDGSGAMDGLDFVRDMAEHGADLEARMTTRARLNNTSFNELGATPFMLAALVADADLMRVLVEVGADPLARGDDGSTALMAAAGLGTRSPGEDAGTEEEVLEAVRTALSFGADVDAVNANGETAMHGAAYKNLPRVVELLADRGADIEVWNRRNKYGWTPLSIARGYRFGNFKPSPVTVAALVAVMRAEGVRVLTEEEDGAVAVDIYARPAAKPAPTPTAAVAPGDDPRGASSFLADVTPLFSSSCLSCHVGTETTPLDLTTLGDDLTDRETFRLWQRIHDRVRAGEMPPPGARRPARRIIDTAVGSVRTALLEANRAERGGQRTPLRRLTRLEYQYTIEDLLGIDPDVAARVANELPEEADSGGFDVVAENQGISPLHVRSYLTAASGALDEALRTGPRPETRVYRIEYAKSPYLKGNSVGEYLGAGIVRMVDDAAVMFFEGGATYTFHSMTEGFQVEAPGRYRVTVDAYPFQAASPVTLTLFHGNQQGVATAALNSLIGSFDLVAPEGRVVEVTPYLRPRDLVAPSLADAYRPPDDKVSYFAPERNVSDYPWEGIAFRTMTIEGPLHEEWPPASARRLLAGIEFDADGAPLLSGDPWDHVVDVVAEFGSRALRRPLTEAEVESWASLARPALDQGLPFLEAVREPLQALLVAPGFVYHAADQGELDDFQLASRLSYFLWRSLPDRELFDLAASGLLSDDEELGRQVDRMLDDPRSARFIADFAGQAFRLDEMNATTPDKALYPEFDSRLGQAMAQETRLFLAELVAEDLGVGHLIDSDFTFLNRRLAEHYGIDGVVGQHMRRVSIPDDSPRGGLLTQASIHKITANGTTTSPVSRGNFVLANLLGRPAPPPPAGVEGLEPDTRGTTTIREQLDRHRTDAVCNSCHRSIDPPGFALEAFDPIGGYRETYRIPGEYGVGGYREGLPVDVTGTTPQGQNFTGIREYRKLLHRNELEQVARHLTSQLIAFATGAPVEFADREAVEGLLRKLEGEGYPLRSMIREVAKSRLMASL